MNSIHDRNRDQLDAMGYQTTLAEESFDDCGRIVRDYDVCSLRPLRVPNGSAPDFTAAANLAVVTFTYASENWPDKFSKVAGRFTEALVKLLATANGPLVRRTVRSVEFIYRLENVTSPRLDDVSVSYSSELYSHGLMARDARATLVLCAGSPDIHVGDNAEWLAGRSPLTVARTVLPEFDASAVSIDVAALVDRFAAAGDLRICTPYLEPARPAGTPAPSDYL